MGPGNYFFSPFSTSGASLLPLICCCSARLFNHFSKMCLFTMHRFCAAVGAGGAQAKEAAVCLWWRMKVFEKSGELTDKARRKLVFLSHSRRAWNCKRNADFQFCSPQCQKSYWSGRTVSSSHGAGLWMVKCRILAGSQIYGPDFVPGLLLNA